MTLNEYLNREIKKGKCPHNYPKCGFKQRKGIEDIVLIPPPSKILGILISQDPPVGWLHFYKYSKNKLKEDEWRKVLFANAIPCSLFNRITKFMDERKKDEERKYLFDMLFNKVYWTHLHKCFTDKSKKKRKFNRKIAEECAEKWLEKELNYAINNKTRFIIALGIPARNWLEGWFKKWKEKEGKGKTMKLIILPHPSGLNRKWNVKNDPGIKKSIRELIGFAKKI